MAIWIHLIPEKTVEDSAACILKCRSRLIGAVWNRDYFPNRSDYTKKHSLKPLIPKGAAR